MMHMQKGASRSGRGRGGGGELQPSRGMSNFLISHHGEVVWKPRALPRPFIRTCGQSSGSGIYIRSHPAPHSERSPGNHAEVRGGSDTRQKQVCAFLCRFPLPPPTSRGWSSAMGQNPLGVLWQIFGFGPIGEICTETWVRDGGIGEERDHFVLYDFATIFDNSRGGLGGWVTQKSAVRVVIWPRLSLASIQ